MTNRELQESGLLWHINEAVLWPLGLALAIERDPADDDDDGRLFIQDRGEPTYASDDPADYKMQADRLSRTMRARLEVVAGVPHRPSQGPR